MEDVLTERMREPIDEGLGDVLRIAGHQLVVPGADLRGGRVVELEAVALLGERRHVGQRPLGERPELPTDAVEANPRLVEPELELVVDVGVEVVEQRASGACFSLLDHFVHLGAKLCKGGLDGFRRAASSEDPVDLHLKANTALDGTEHLVGGAEHAVEELALVGQKLEDTLVCPIELVQEVDHDDVEALSIPVAPPNSLFNPLGVPGQVVVDHQRAELEVQTFGAGLRCDQ